MGSAASRRSSVSSRAESKQSTRASSVSSSSSVADHSEHNHPVPGQAQQKQKVFARLRNLKSTNNNLPEPGSPSQLTHPAKLRAPNDIGLPQKSVNMQPHGHEVIDLLSESDDEAIWVNQYSPVGMNNNRERGGGRPRQGSGGVLLQDNQPAIPAIQINDGSAGTPTPGIRQQGPHNSLHGGTYGLLPSDDAFAAGNPEPWILDENFDAQDFNYTNDEALQQAIYDPIADLPLEMPQVESKMDCVNNMTGIFPGISREYVATLYDTVAKTSDELVSHILDLNDNDKPWPKENEKEKQLKRKREIDEDEIAIRKYTAVDRKTPSGYNVLAKMRECLRLEFAQIPMAFIDSVIHQNKERLFPTYRVLEEAERTWNEIRPPYNKLKKARISPELSYLSKAHPEKLDEFLARPDLPALERELLVEFQTARKVRRKADMQREAERQAERDEEFNLLQAQADGTMSECGCCFGDYPLNRMVHCNNEDSLHWFCRNCAKQMAENEIGNSKYELNCMSMDGCKAGFSNDQRNLFLDQKSFIALERNEQEAMLRMAGIENLASCPFCPYAAEYPPVDINKEFQCMAPDCEKVSCRLCNMESHIPKSCEEHAKETGLSIRRQIEEAMSAALIRKCNKCGTPFVKEEGCNKMTCTRNGCYNVQCYVCSKSCGYDHFDDLRRGGKGGNCPLFESVEQRHDSEVQKAEKNALEKIRAEHPEYSEEDLKVKMSKNVAKDDARRKAKDPRGNLPFAPPGFNVQENLRVRNLGVMMMHNLPNRIEPEQMQNAPAMRDPRGRLVPANIANDMAMLLGPPPPPPAPQAENDADILGEVEMMLDRLEADNKRFNIGNRAHRKRGGGHAKLQANVQPRHPHVPRPVLGEDLLRLRNAQAEIAATQQANRRQIDVGFRKAIGEKIMNEPKTEGQSVDRQAPPVWNGGFPQFSAATGLQDAAPHGGIQQMPGLVPPRFGPVQHYGPAKVTVNDWTFPPAAPDRQLDRPMHGGLGGRRKQ